MPFATEASTAAIHRPFVADSSCSEASTADCKHLALELSRVVVGPTVAFVGPHRLSISHLY